MWRKPWVWINEKEADKKTCPGPVPAEPYVNIPDSISPEAQAVLRIMPDPNQSPPAPDPSEIEQWKALQEVMETRNLQRQNGDYTQGFPPTLIQGGTKEIFLSNFVRHYQALDAAGQTVKLDLYDGMIHVFMADSISQANKR